MNLTPSRPNYFDDENDDSKRLLRQKSTKQPPNANQRRGLNTLKGKYDNRIYVRWLLTNCNIRPTKFDCRAVNNKRKKTVYFSRSIWMRKNYSMRCYECVHSFKIVINKR